MISRALIGAIGGAIIGALIWAAITYTTGYEVGYVAWGIGILVGGGARALGGCNQTTGLACAALALTSIFCGKLLAVEFAFPGEVRKVLEKAVVPEMYDAYQADAEAFAKLTSEDQYAQYMTTHDMRDEEASGPVTADEIAQFKENVVPGLKRFQQDKPTFEDWRAQTIEEAMADANKSFSVVDAVVEDLGLMDIVFAVLGVITAYKLGSGSDE